MIQPKLIGYFFEKLHFSLGIARLAGNLVERIKKWEDKQNYLEFEKELKIKKGSTFRTHFIRTLNLIFFDII